MLSRGVRPLKLETLGLIRVWAALTGIVLAIVYFLLAYEGFAGSDTLPMIVAGIGGFELFLFGQDRRGNRSGGTHG